MSKNLVLALSLMLGLSTCSIALADDQTSGAAASGDKSAADGSSTKPKRKHRLGKRLGKRLSNLKNRMHKGANKSAAPADAAPTGGAPAQ